MVLTVHMNLPFFFELFLLKQKSVKMAHLSKQEVIFFIFYSLLLLHGGWPVSAMYFLKMNNSVFTSVSVGVCVCVHFCFYYWKMFLITGLILALKVLAHTSAGIQGAYNRNFQDCGQILIHLLNFFSFVDLERGVHEAYLF